MKDKTSGKEIRFKEENGRIVFDTKAGRVYEIREAMKLPSKMILGIGIILLVIVSTKYVGLFKH